MREVTSSDDLGKMSDPLGRFFRRQDIPKLEKAADSSNKNENQDEVSWTLGPYDIRSDIEKNWPNVLKKLEEGNLQVTSGPHIYLEEHPTRSWYCNFETSPKSV